MVSEYPSQMYLANGRGRKVAEVLTGVGCPSKMESTLRRVSRCS